MNEEFDITYKELLIIIALSFFSGIFFGMMMNGKSSNLEKEIYRIGKEISVIKTVMIMKHILPPDLSSNEENK